MRAFLKLFRRDYYIGAKIKEEARQALLHPDRDGNSILSCLLNGTDYPYWEAEEETIKQLAALGIITRDEWEAWKWK